MIQVVLALDLLQAVERVAVGLVSGSYLLGCFTIAQLNGP